MKHIFTGMLLVVLLISVASVFPVVSEAPLYYWLKKDVYFKYTLYSEKMPSPLLLIDYASNRSYVVESRDVLNITLTLRVLDVNGSYMTVEYRLDVFNAREEE